MRTSHFVMVHLLFDCQVCMQLHLFMLLLVRNSFWGMNGDLISSCWLLCCWKQLKLLELLECITVIPQGVIEMQKMQQAQQREAAAAASKANDVDSEEDSDAQVDKQRQMDDWKDDNPSGWGNSKLRPTA